MPEEIRCPECESLNVEKIPDKVTFGSEEAHDELAKEIRPHKYECLDCRFIFFTSNVKE
jgi:rubredoxin